MRWLVAALALGAAGCTDSSGASYVPLGPSAAIPVQTVAIDANATVGADGGKGAGIFVDYASGGSWQISATCDTLVQTCDTPDGGCSCSWDLVASVPLPGPLTVSDKTTEFNSDFDRVLVNDKGSVRIIFSNNTTEVDGVKLAAPAGASLTLDVVLGGYHDFLDDEQGTFVGSLVNWVSGGALVAGGAPSNPVTFAPSTP